MAQYRKKPIVVEAMQWTGDNEAEIQAWTGTDIFHKLDPEDRENADDPDHTGNLLIAANSCHAGLADGEWIIRDAKGFYPCEADVFGTTYEEVT